MYKYKPQTYFEFKREFMDKFGNSDSYYLGQSFCLRFIPQPYCYSSEDNLVNKLWYSVDNKDVEELIRCADKVVFSGTGAGLIALMMGKQVEISNTHRLKTYEMFGKREDYVEWMCGKPGATERVRKVIKNVSN